MVLTLESIEILFSKAKDMEVKGDYTSCIQIYKHLDQYYPSNISIKKSLANAVLNSGNYSEALFFYEQCLLLDQKQADIYVNVGAIHKINSNLDIAIDYFRKAIVLNPNYIIANSNLGICLYEKKIFDKALGSFKLVARLEPDNHQACFHAGDCSRQLGRLDLAIHYFSRAIKI